MTVANSVALYQLTAELQAALAELDVDGELNTSLADRLDALQIARDTKLAGCSAARRNLIAMLTGIDEEIERLKRIGQAVQNRLHGLEQYLKSDLEKLGETKFEHPTMGFSIRKNPASVVINDGTELPAEFVREKTVVTKTDDKVALLAAYKTWAAKRPANDADPDSLSAWLAADPLPDGVSVVQRTRLHFNGE